MQYNRQKAMEYAEKYYYDGNSEYINFDKQTNNNYTDCANFASQCIHAGGMNHTNIWKPYTTAWKGANSLRRFVASDNKCRSDADASRLEPGDLVFRLEPKTANKSSKPLRQARHVAVVREVQENTIYVYQHGQKQWKARDYGTYAKGVWKAGREDTLFYHIEKVSTSDLPRSSGYSDRYGTRTLKIRSTGNFVRNMQDDLNKLGYNLGNADGIFGVNTEKAVKNFQKEYGLKADGLFGRMSKEKLYSLIFNTKNNENKEIKEADKMNKKENKELKAYNTAIIMLENGMLNIRKEPDVRSEVVTKLYPFQIVSAIDVNDKWCVVYVLNGEMIGYAMKKFVKIVSNSEDFLSTAKEW